MKNEIQQQHQFTSDEKLAWWGYGEWVEEPDWVSFYHNDIACIVRRVAIEEPFTKDLHVFGGHLCGYVQIPADHPYHHKCYENMDINVHFGLTFGEVSVGHWIGFDCGHTGDIVPSMKLLKDTSYSHIAELFPIPDELKDSWLFNPNYKNIDYCIDQCKSMADQLVQIARANDPNLINKMIGTDEIK